MDSEPERHRTERFPERHATSNAVSEPEQQETERSSEGQDTSNAVSEPERQGVERSSEGHNIPTPFTALHRLPYERPYEEILDESQEAYVATCPPLIFVNSAMREGDRRDIVLATATGNFPRDSLSVVTIVARRWDHRRFLFWTLDHGTNRIIVRAKATSGWYGGCHYFRWLGKSRGKQRTGFSERIFAYAKPSARMSALYPNFSRKDISPFEGLDEASLPDRSAQQSITQDAFDDPQDEAEADASTTQAFGSSTTMLGQEQPRWPEEPELRSDTVSKKWNKHARQVIPSAARSTHAGRIRRIIAPQLPTAAADETDQKRIVVEDRAFYGNDHRPPYVGNRRNGHKQYLTSLKAFILVQGHHAEVAAIQTVSSRNWNAKYRYWTIELDGVVRIVKKSRIRKYKLRLWLGHEHGFGEVVGFGDHADDRLKSDDVRVPKSSSADGSLEAERSGEYSTTSWLQRRLTL